MNKKVAQYIKSIKDKNIHVVGSSGAEGAAIINFLYSHGIKKITAHDFQPDLPSFRKRFKQTNSTLTPKQRARILKNIINDNIKLNLKNSYLSDLLSADLIFLTQAWYIYSPNFPLVQQAIDKNIPISSMTKLYFDLAPCPIIGITGSQGKSTTTTLVTKILQNAGKKVYAGGNIRDIFDQLLSKIDEITSKDLIVMEISNRQLTIDHHQSPHIACITNITPNHIEEHGSYQKYRQIKESILKYQSDKDYAILNYDNPFTKKLITKYPSQKILFSTKYSVKGPHIQNDNIIFKSQILLPTTKIKMIGEHNLSNILAALATIQPLNIPKKEIIKTLEKFTGIPHRLQLVATVNQIKYIDDMKSSTPTATLAALKSILNKQSQNTIHLIIGGNHKNTSYHQLALFIKNKKITIHFLSGTTTTELQNELQQITAQNPSYSYEDISSCLQNIHNIAKINDIVLLSPAGAEFQQIHLSNKFTLEKLVKQKEYHQ